MTYYNTNHLQGDELRKAQIQAETQEQKVLAYFEANPHGLFTREDINEAVLPNAPLTSAQRAITNLTNEGLLIKTGTKRRGKYGKVVYCWRLARTETEPHEQIPLI